MCVDNRLKPNRDLLSWASTAAPACLPGRAAGGYSIAPYILWVYHTFYGWCVWRLINTPGCLLREQEQGNGDRGTSPWPGDASQAPRSPVRTSHSHPYVWLEYGVNVEHKYGQDAGEACNLYVSSHIYRQPH